MAFDLAKFLARFVDEARENCTRIGDGLLALEKSPGDAETLNALFRAAHTIKGSSRMMKLLNVTELAHRMEDVLDAVRSGKILLTPGISDLLFKAVDSLSAMLDQIAADGQQGDIPAKLCQELLEASAGKAAADPASPVPAPISAAEPGQTEPERISTPPAADLPHAEPIQEKDRPAAITSAGKGHKADYYRINAEKLDDLIRLMGEIVSEQGRARRHVSRLKEIERSAARFAETLAETLDSGSIDDSGRDNLLSTMQSLHLSIRQSIRTLFDVSLMQDHLVGDLQETSLKMRMLPIATVFDSLRRTVRDLAREHGKEIDFIVDGSETELDRKIVERIGDPLIHMIRNSLDHGLESADERLAAGKPAKGTIALSAFYDGGCVTIALSDDGRGISPDRIREKALAKKLYDAEALAKMSRSELTNLIFLPGFSTSPIITDLSGRGVGMDVVRKNIVDDLKGSIIIETQEGEGTTFFMRLPLNLAVFPLVLVSVAEKTCAIPATSTNEMLTVEQGDLIEIVNKRAIRLREQIIPVENLAAILALPRNESIDQREMLMIIIRDGDEKIGLIVDDILGREEMVVKPLPSHLQNLRMVSGVTIGDQNSIINVLHVPEIFRSSHQLTEGNRTADQDKTERKTTILVVDDSYNTREIEKSILEAYGYTVFTAGDGEEAFEKSREEMYDLVITDVEMPRLDGFSLTERLRADERYRNVPIIIVTSREKDEDKRRGIMVGADAYIVKGGFDQSSLLETIRNLIG